MLLRDLREDGGWIYSSWELTYPTGWEGILKAAETIYEYYTDCEVLADGSLAPLRTPRDIASIPEVGNLTVRGLSTILGVPVMITFYNQTRAVSVMVAVASDEFSNTDYKKFNISMCQYMDSIELAMSR
jgi:hypothetical protein